MENLQLIKMRENANTKCTLSFPTLTIFIKVCVHVYLHYCFVFVDKIIVCHQQCFHHIIQNIITILLLQYNISSKFPEMWRDISL